MVKSDGSKFNIPAKSTITVSTSDLRLPIPTDYNGEGTLIHAYIRNTGYDYLMCTNSTVNISSGLGYFILYNPTESELNIDKFIVSCIYLL